MLANRILNFSFLLSLLFIFISCKLFSYNPNINTLHAKLVSGRGLLSRTAKSTWNLLSQEPTALSTGDILQSDVNSYLTIHYPNNSICYVYPNTNITIIEKGLLIKNGEVLFDLKADSEGYKVFTPYSEISVLGTKFLVKVDKYGKTTVQTIRGIIAIKAKNEQKLRQLVLQAGMQATVDNLAQTPLNYTKFDPMYLENNLVDSWAKLKVTSSIYSFTQGLPPIRPISESKLQHFSTKTESQELESAKDSFLKRQDTLDKYPNIRSRLNFFQSIREQIYLQKKSNLLEDNLYNSQSLPPKKISWQKYYPLESFEANEPYLKYKANTSGHTRRIGYNLPAPTYTYSEREILSEINYLEQNLFVTLKKIENLEKRRIEIINQITSNSNPNSEELRHELSLVSKKIQDLYDLKDHYYYNIRKLRNILK